MTLSIGFLGHGFMGKAHANGLARLPMFFPDAPVFERSVLVGRDESRLERARAVLGFTRTTTDWRTALSEIDVLYNLGPNALHADPSIAALERGVHVLCEKPIATGLSEARVMAMTAANSDALAGCGFNYRFLPAIQYAKRLIDDGRLGELYHARTRYLQDWLADPDTEWSWRLDANVAGSGALGDLGSHAVDLLRFLCGGQSGEIESVSGSLQTYVEERPRPDGPKTEAVTVDDACWAHLIFENGTIGTLEASRCAPGHKNDLTVTVHGSRGSVRFSLERPNELDVMRTGSRGYETILVTDEEDPYLEAWWPPGHVLGWEHSFVHESFEFLSAVARGDAYEPTFRTALAVQNVLHAVEESHRTSETVELDVQREE